MGLIINIKHMKVKKKDRTNEELEYAQNVMRRLHCPVIDVSAKAIEETANLVLDIIKRNKELYDE